MKSFGLLMGLAFADLVVAGIMVARGERGIGLLFLVLAVATAGFALFSGSSLQRDARGRLQPAEPPFANFLGAVGAVAILGAAAYVATITTRPAPPKSKAEARSPAPAQRASAWTPPPSQPRPAQRAPGLLYKCEDVRGHASFQSQPCAPGSRQVWARPVTPEPEPPPGRRPRQYNDRGQGTSLPAYSWNQSPPSASGERSAACQAARTADAAYRRRPLSQVTHDGLRRHGDAIRNACR